MITASAAGSKPETWLVLAVSIDGRLAPAQGGAAQLGGSGDRRVLEEALAWADGCLIGANTLRLHGSTCLIHAPDLLAQRRAQGRALQPVSVAVSRSGALPANLAWFNQPVERWLLTSSSLSEDRDGLVQSPVAGFVDASGLFSRVLNLTSWSESLMQLRALGLGNILVLGGAALAASLLEAGCIDGMQLTICPQLLGGPYGWIPPSISLPFDLQAWQLEEQRLLSGDELMLKYRRQSCKGCC